MFTYQFPKLCKSGGNSVISINDLFLLVHEVAVTFHRISYSRKKTFIFPGTVHNSLQKTVTVLLRDKYIYTQKAVNIS